MTDIRLQVGTQWFVMNGDHFTAAFRNPGTPTIAVQGWVSGNSAPIISNLPLDPEQILKIITDEITAAPDSFAAAGEWITRLTNGITQAIREEDKP